MRRKDGYTRAAAAGDHNMIIAGMAVAPTTVKVGYMVHGFDNRKLTIQVWRPFIRALLFILQGDGVDGSQEMKRE